MKKTDLKQILISHTRSNNRCLSCGASENMGRRKYCSIECRQLLRYKLNMRSGLLKALNTKFATFYFTEPMIFLDILPYGAVSLFSFIFPRTNGKIPAEDFSMMANVLGNAWWAERRRTNKRYIATQHILERAKNKNSTSSIKPFEIVEPARMAKSLTFLKLDRSDLDSPELQRIIKSAYRQQAKRYHPDQGGDAAVFRKVYQAYEQMMDWAENPTFTRRRGFPDKWFYEGYSNRWIQPAPIPV